MDKNVVTMRLIIDTLEDISYSCVQMAITWHLGRALPNAIPMAQYMEQYFVEPAALQVIETFKEELKDTEEQIIKQNEGLELQPFHPLHSQILEVVSDKPRSVGASIVILEERVRCQIVEIWDCHWLQNFILISLCIEIASSDDKPCFSSEGDAAPHNHTASTKRCYSIGAAISIAFSVSSPHFDPMIQLPKAESGLINEHNVPPHVQVPVHVLPTPAQMGLEVKGSHGRPPGSQIRSEIGCLQSVLDCLGREPSAILSCKP
ncbi:hypothetical protein MHYP_G00009760 [Metynnis hypsauchen]